MGKPRGVGFPITVEFQAALRAWLAAKKERNESSLARDVGCTPAAINQILKAKPGKASTLLPKICRITKIPLPFPGLPAELQRYMSEFALLYDEDPDEARNVAGIASKLRSRKGG